ncbi:MAG: MFS transporter [Chloroflexota bacterium]
MFKLLQQPKFRLLGGLYVTQALGLAFVITAVPASMRQGGATLEEISVIYVLGLIWVLKFLWAPFVDRYGSKKHGHYRSWLIVLQSLLIVLLVAVSFFDIDSQMSILLLLFGVAAFVSATQDIAADALGVTILAPEERGLGNSIQISGNLIGSMVGGGVVLITYRWLGWQASLLVLAAATALPLFNILRHKEQPAPVDSRPQKVSHRDLARFFKRPGTLRWVAVLTTYMIGISAANALLNPMLVDLGWSLDQIGFTTNIVGLGLSILGAAAAGGLMQRIGRKTAAIIASLIMTISIVGLFAPATGNSNIAIIYGSICLMLFGFGVGVTVLATMIMDKSDPSSAGTDYTLQYSLFQGMSLVLGGSLLAAAETIQYSGVLWIAMGFSVLGLIIVSFYNDFQPLALESKTDNTSVIAGLD